MSKDRDATVESLAWLVEGGADEAIEDSPKDRLATGPEARGSAAGRGGHDGPAAAAKQPGPGHHPSPAPDAWEDSRRASPQGAFWQPAAGELQSSDAAVSSARHAAAAAHTIEELKEALLRFEGCPLKATATNLALYDGNPGAQVMIIGEAPGAEEDRQGLPFVGAAGHLLDRMLAPIGLDRDSVYITNLLFWRPPGNRSPTASEVAACLPFLERQVELVDPAFLLLLGASSVKTLLARQEGILKLRGRWAHYQHAGLVRPIPAMPTLHPAYLLRQPAQKRLAWRDFLAFQQAVQSGQDPLTAI